MKKQEKTELSKEKIIAAAMEEFARNGYGAATVNSICDTGIPKGLIYHNFKNKDALYLACIGRSFTTLLTYLPEEGNSTDLRQYMDARLLFFQEQEFAAKLFFEAILKPPAHLADDIRQMQDLLNERNRCLCRSMFSSLTLRSHVTEAEALEYFTLLQDMFNGYFSNMACSGMPFSELITAHEEHLWKTLDFMLYGIAERKPEI